MDQKRNVLPPLQQNSANFSFHFLNKKVSIVSENNQERHFVQFSQKVVSFVVQLRKTFRSILQESRFYLKFNYERYFVLFYW